MSGDFSKFTFDPKKRYSQVLMQQGRVILDSDWNEMQSIISRNNQMLVHDLVGEVAYPVANPALTPRVEGGLGFDGADDFVFVEKNTVDFSTNRHFSIVATVTPKATIDEGMIFSQWQSQVDMEVGIRLGLTAEGRFFLQRTIGSRDSIEIDTLIAEEAVSFGERVQLAATFNGHSLKLFMNDRLVAEAREVPDSWIEIVPITIGATVSRRKPVKFFHGAIHELAIWSCALSDAEIEAQMSMERAVGEIGLLAWWPMSECRGEICHDISGNGFHGRLGAGLEKHFPVWDSPRISFSAGRVYLDGMLSEQFDELALPYQMDGSGHFLAYLAMNQVMVSALDDPNLLDPALQGLDTTMRTQVQLEVHLFPAHGGYADADELAQHWSKFADASVSSGRMKITTLPNRPLFENTLYRVQVYQTSHTETGDSLDIVWTSDNSSLSYKVIHLSEDSLTLQGMARSNTRLRIGSYFSLMDVNGQPLHDEGTLLQVADLDFEEETISFVGKIRSASLPLVFQHWQAPVSHIQPDDQGKLTLNIDNRLQLEFSHNARYQQGDFWLIPARRASNTITKPEDVWLEPDNARTVLQPIAGFQAMNSAIWVADDFRKMFRTARDMSDFARTTGDTFTGPVVMENTFKLDGDTEINGYLAINGEVSHHFVGTPQLKDHAVTHHKVQPNLGLHLGQCLLSQNAVAPPGYSVIGKLAGMTDNSAWRLMDVELPLNGPFAAVNVGERIFLIYGSGEMFEVDPRESGGSVEFMPRSSWPGMAVRRFGICALGDQIYIAGGETEEQKKTDEFYCYSVLSDSWVRKKDLKHPVSHVALCACEGSIYAMGGMQDSLFGLLKHAPTHKNFCYDPDADEWDAMRNMPDYRYSGSAASVNGVIYYVGGSDRELSGILSESFQSTTFVYSPATDSWEERQPIPLSRSRFGMIVLNQKLYCLGGKTGTGYTGNVQTYDPEIDHWESDASVNVPRSHIAPVIVDGYLVALGGKVGEGYVGYIEEQQRCSEFYVHRLDRYL